MTCKLSGAAAAVVAIIGVLFCSTYVSADSFEDYASEIEMTCINEDGKVVSIMSKSGDVIMDSMSMKAVSQSFEKKSGEERYIAKMDGGGFELEFYFDFEDRRASMTMAGQRINMVCY